jgi:hypothetical protein
MAPTALQKEFLEKFQYNPETGKLYKHTSLGLKEVTSGCQGYKRIRLNRKHYQIQYYAQEVIWIMLYGSVPDGYQIDHINHIRDDNRLNNLRLVTVQEQRQNMSLSKRNKSGRVGVRWDSINKKWSAEIAGDFLGRFSSFEEACSAREKAEQTRGFHPNHGKRA